MYLLFHFIQYEGSNLVGWFPTLDAVKDHLARMKAEDEYIDLNDYEYVYADPTRPCPSNEFNIPYQKVFG